MVSALLDNQVSADIVLPSGLKNAEEYSALVLANCGVIETEVREKLLAYAKNGGTLFLCGVDTALLFKRKLKITKAEEGELAIIRGGDMRALMSQRYLNVTTGATVRNVMNPVKLEGDVNVTNPPPKKSIQEEVPSLIEIAYGKGKIFAILFNVGVAYEEERSAQLRRLVGEVLQQTDLKLKVSGTHYVETALMQKGNKTYVHLLNTAGEHRAEKVKTFDEIPPIYDISVSYRTDKKPQSVKLLPQNVPLEFTYERGRIAFNIEKIDIHVAVGIE